MIARPLLIALLALATACTVQPSPTNGAAPSGGGGGSNPAPRADEPAPPPLSCLQVVQCIVSCAETDTACPDACNAKGGTEAQSQVVALAQCVSDNKCEDAECTEANCASELTTCLASSKPPSGGSPLQGEAPPGDIPPDLVGTWAGADFGATERIQFNADGTGTWMSSVTTNYSGCLSFTRTTRTGSMVVTDTKIAFYATKITQDVQNCKPPAARSEDPGATEEITWSRRDASTILIVNSACAAKYVGYEYSIGQYCTARLTRE